MKTKTIVYHVDQIGTVYTDFFPKGSFSYGGKEYISTKTHIEWIIKSLQVPTHLDPGKVPDFGGVPVKLYLGREGLVVTEDSSSYTHHEVSLGTHQAWTSYLRNCERLVEEYKKTTIEVVVVLLDDIE